MRPQHNRNRRPLTSSITLGQTKMLPQTGVQGGKNAESTFSGPAHCFHTFSLDPFDVRISLSRSSLSYDKLCHVFDDWVSNRTSTGNPHDRRHHESPTHFGFSLFTEKFHNTLAFMGRTKKWTLRLHSRFGWP